MNVKSNTNTNTQTYLPPISQETLAGLSSNQRTQLYKERERESGKIAARVREGLKEPKTKLQSDLDHYKAQREARKQAGEKFSGYDAKIKELEAAVKEEKRMLDFTSTVEYKTTMDVFRSRAESIRERSGNDPAMLADLSVAEQVYKKTGDKDALFDSVAGLLRTLDTADRAKAAELQKEIDERNQSALAADLETAKLEVESAQLMAGLSEPLAEPE